MLTTATGVVPLGAIIQMKEGVSGVLVRFVPWQQSRGYMADLKIGRMRPITIQRLVQGTFQPLVKVLFIPPSGFIHPFLVQSVITEQTKSLRAFVATHLATKERFHHSKYGEFWQVEATVRLKKEFLRQKNAQYEVTSERNGRKNKESISYHCIACGESFLRTTKAALRCISCQHKERYPKNICYCRVCGVQFARAFGSHEIRCQKHRKKAVA